MGLRLDSPHYLWSKRWGASQLNRMSSIIQRTLDPSDKMTRTGAYNYARSIGIAYRKKDFLEDMNRAMATEYSRDQAHYDKANAFFDAAKAYKEQEGIEGWAKPIDFTHRWINGSLETLEEIKAASALEKKETDPSPSLWDDAEEW